MKHEAVGKATAMIFVETIRSEERTKLLGFVGKLLKVIVYPSNVQCYKELHWIYLACEVIVSFNHSC